MNLEDVIPEPEHRTRHSRAVGAPPEVVWDELHGVTMSALPLGRTLEAVRLLPARLAGRRHRPLAGRSFLDVTPIPVLFSERPSLVISAGLSQAWRLLGGRTPPELDAAALRSWSQPGWIKVGMEFRLEPTRQGTFLSTETRVVATDARTRRAFAAYWFLIRPGSGAIRAVTYEYQAGGSEPGAGGSAVWPPAYSLRSVVGHHTEACSNRSAISRAVTSCMVASATDARPSVSITSSPSSPSGK